MKKIFIAFLINLLSLVIIILKYMHGEITFINAYIFSTGFSIVCCIFVSIYIKFVLKKRQNEVFSFPKFCNFLFPFIIQVGAIIALLGINYYIALFTHVIVVFILTVYCGTQMVRKVD